MRYVIPAADLPIERGKWRYAELSRFPDTVMNTDAIRGLQPLTETELCVGAARPVLAVDVSKFTVRYQWNPVYLL